MYKMVENIEAKLNEAIRYQYYQNLNIYSILSILIVKIHSKHSFVEG